MDAYTYLITRGVSVATKALFHKDMLAGDLPSLSPTPKAAALLIWGGSTSVGSCAIQLAAAAGYEVITTASPRNFDRVLRLGATQVFDYDSPTVRRDLLAAFAGKTTAGAVANAGLDREGYPLVVEICAEVVRSCPGRRVVAMTMVPFWGPSLEGVRCVFVEPLRGARGLASSVFHDFLWEALRRGSFRPVPEAEVVGNGLECVQKAMDVLKAGVSAKKIVVTL